MRRFVKMDHIVNISRMEIHKMDCKKSDFFSFSISITELQISSYIYYTINKKETHRRVNIATSKFTSSFKSSSKEILWIIHLTFTIYRIYWRRRRWFVKSHQHIYCVYCTVEFNSDVRCLHKYSELTRHIDDKICH